MKKRIVAIMILIGSFFSIGLSKSIAEPVMDMKLTDYASHGEEYENIKRVMKSVFLVEAIKEDGHTDKGSGFILFNECLFITCQHVIQGASYLIITDDEGSKYNLNQVVVSDQEHDIAILKCSESMDYRPLEYNTSFSDLKLKQQVTIISSPKGLAGTVTDGKISKEDRVFIENKDTHYIQIDASISQGSSGGCLLNEDLEVIGIVSCGVEEGQNIGFAIPIFIAEELYEQWNGNDTVKLGTKESWDTVGAGLHSRVSGKYEKVQANKERTEETTKSIAQEPTSTTTSKSSEEPAETMALSLNPSDSPTVRNEEKLRLETLRENIQQPYQSVGNTVTFGRYEQNQENGSEDIEWIVLDAQDNKSLLLSKYELQALPYNKEVSDITWAECSLRNWLNNEFLNDAFTDGERSAILLTEVDNSQNQGYNDWNTGGGNNSQDLVFLLSYTEVNRYLNDKVNSGENKYRHESAPTKYAILNGAYACDRHKTEDGNKAGWWWLRSPGNNQFSVAVMDCDGSLRTIDANNTSGGVRPALWLDLNAVADIYLDH